MWGTGREFQRAVIDLVDLEVNQRVEALESAIATLKAYKERWSSVGDLLVLDTNFYVEHPDEVQDGDLAQLTAATTPGWKMHVLVPLLVVDELDRLKRDNRVRSRARTALKTLNTVFAHVSEDQPMGRLREDAPDLGPVTMELLFDPPDHERLPDHGCGDRGPGAGRTEHGGPPGHDGDVRHQHGVQGTAGGTQRLVADAAVATARVCNHCSRDRRGGMHTPLSMSVCCAGCSS